MITAISLEDYTATAKQITIRIKPHDRFKTRYRVQFIGKGGRILQDSPANPAAYSIKGDEGYVRARIPDSNGKMAWTQPVFVH